MTNSILIVDDDHAYAETVALVLRYHEFRATGVYDAHAVIAHLAEQLPDLIVCDVKMPGMDGVTLARCIRDLGCGCPILLMSGERLPPVDVPGVSTARKTTDTEEHITLIERQFA
jgi:DNA-binding response OmpR family regulator